MKPVLLLDLDGVLNPFAATSCPDGYLEHEFYPGEGPERYCLAHADWIRELAEVADVRWATAWGDEANTIYAPKLGVDPLPFVTFPPPPFLPEQKVPAIAAAVGDRPVVWVDDNHTDAGRRWAADRDAPTLLVPVEPSTGWIRSDVDAVLKWCAELGV
jgi:hypothetical protein